MTFTDPIDLAIWTDPFQSSEFLSFFASLLGSKGSSTHLSSFQDVVHFTLFSFHHSNFCLIILSFKRVCVWLSKVYNWLFKGCLSCYYYRYSYDYYHALLELLTICNFGELLYDLSDSELFSHSFFKSKHSAYGGIKFNNYSYLPLPRGILFTLLLSVTIMIQHYTGTIVILAFSIWNDANILILYLDYGKHAPLHICSKKGHQR